jgi:hypothetical protein
MTDTLLSPDDTGEIPQPVGETRIRIDTGEQTRNLAEYVITAPSFDAIPRRVFEMDDTVIYMPETIGLAGPQSPPPPLPPVPPAPPQYDMDTERLSLLGTVAGLDGDLYSAPPTLRRSVPYVIPADARRWSRPRHAKPAPLWARAALLVGGAMVAGAFVALAVLAVVR